MMKSEDVSNSIQESLTNFDVVATNIYFIERTQKRRIQEKFDIVKSEPLEEFQTKIKSEHKEWLISFSDSIKLRKNLRKFYDDLGPEQTSYLNSNTSQILSTAVSIIYKKDITELQSFKRREKFHGCGYYFSFPNEEDDIIIFSYIEPNSLLKPKKKFGIIFQNGLLTSTDEILVVQEHIDCVYLRRYDCFYIQNRQRFEKIFGLDEYNRHTAQIQLKTLQESGQIAISNSMKELILKKPALTAKITRMVKNNKFDKPINYFEKIKNEVEKIKIEHNINDEVWDMAIHNNSVIVDTVRRVETYISAVNGDYVRDLVEYDTVFKILGGKERLA